MKALLAGCIIFPLGFAAWACSGKTDTPTEASEVVSTPKHLPCDVDELLAARCRSCHGNTPKYGAPMPLVTFEDLHAAARSTPGKKVYEVARDRVHDAVRPMPPQPNPSLTAEEKGVLDAWIQGGASSQENACRPTDAGAPPVVPLSCEPDQHIRPATPFTVPARDDTYVCYGFDTVAEAKRHVIAAAPRIDNTRVVHHVLLYQSPEAVSPEPTRCGSGGRVEWRLVTGWAPGGQNLILPPEAGFAEEPGPTHWVVQIHYNNEQGLDGEADESGYDLCSTTELRPNDADILATGTIGIKIPARSTTTTTCEFSVPASLGRLNVVSSWAHMHRLGRAQSAVRIRGDEETVMLDVPNFDFEVGGGANVVNVDIGGGDVVRTMCKWQNTTNAEVSFGEGTGDEMCFAFLTYYPKIAHPNFHWMAPSVAARCNSVSQ